MKNKIIIGLTGGIGSGKTTVAKLFENIGVPVYYADDAAKRLMNENPDLKQQLIKEFGAETFINKKLNTKYLANIVFNNPKRLQTLESIVHPFVKKDLLYWVQKQAYPYVIVENAVLHKSGMDKVVDQIIWVLADIDKRISRVKKRDQLNVNEILKRIENQNLPIEMRKNSDFIIYNNGNIENLRHKVDEISFKLKNMLKKG